MYYELYIDSLLLINFVMNLYLLILVDKSMMHTATRTRIVAGAALGAVLYLIPFFLPGLGTIKVFIGGCFSVLGMLEATFRLRSVKGFLRAAERLILYSLFVGGSLLFIIRCFPKIRQYLLSVFGLLGLGALVFLKLFYLLEGKKKNNICQVTLVGKGAKITVNALIDTGNSLIEPISGKPVSILEKKVFDGLWRDEKPEGYRIVPYHSIGKKRGILHSYLLPELKIEIDGVIKVCKNVYIGVGEEELQCGEGYSFILNPILLEEEKKEKTGS